MKLLVAYLVAMFAVVCVGAYFVARADDAAPTREDLLKAQIATVQAQEQTAAAMTTSGQLQAENGRLWTEKLQVQEQSLKSELDALKKPGNSDPKKDSGQER